MRKKQAFTLIELLVVIAIIALLMAVLMPALSKARRQTQAVVCISNVRQLGMALLLYSEENEGAFLGELGTAGDGTRWFACLVDYFFGTGKQTPENMTEGTCLMCLNVRVP